MPRRTLHALKLPGLLLVTLPCLACAVRPAVPRHFELRSVEQRAVAALALGEFDSARPDLLWLASRCEAHENRLRALLLLAAADLDPMNGAGSARAAAMAAAAYIRSADAAEDRLPVAHALFRLAADRGALEPRGERDPTAALVELSVSCGGAGSPRSLPSVPGARVPDRVSTLESALSSRSDSLGIVTARVRALEAELARIQAILRDEVTPLSLIEDPR
jgi:hypothetical protein